MSKQKTIKIFSIWWVLITFALSGMSQSVTRSFIISQQAVMRITDPAYNPAIVFDTAFYNGWDIVEEGGLRSMVIDYTSGKVFVTSFTGRLHQNAIKYADLDFVNVEDSLAILKIQLYNNESPATLSWLELTRYTLITSFRYELLFKGNDREMKYTLAPVDIL